MSLLYLKIPIFVAILLAKNIISSQHYKDTHFWYHDVWPQRPFKVTKGYFYV